MNRHERLTALLELVVERESVHLDTIVAELGVSPATARRDLDHLAQQQLITRTRGGATTSPTSSDLPLRYKAGRQPAEKRRIAQAAAAMVARGEVVGLGGGTTTTEVAREIVMRSDLRDADAGALVVVTNAVNIANELAVRRHVRVVLTGGVVRAMSYELIGPLAVRILEDIAIDTLFVGVNALNPEAGAFAHHEEEAAVNAALAANARRVVVVADHTKVGRRTAFARICSVEEIDALVTDDGTDADALERLREQGVEVVVA